MDKFGDKRGGFSRFLRSQSTAIVLIGSMITAGGCEDTTVPSASATQPRTITNAAEKDSFYKDNSFHNLLVRDEKTQKRLEAEMGRNLTLPEVHALFRFIDLGSRIDSINSLDPVESGPVLREIAIEDVQEFSDYDKQSGRWYQPYAHPERANMAALDKLGYPQDLLTKIASDPQMPAALSDLARGKLGAATTR